MTTDQFLERLAPFLAFLGNAIVCAAAVRINQEVAKRWLALIAWSAGLGAIVAIWPWALQALGSTLSPLASWYTATLLGIADLVLWTSGCWLLFRDYRQLLERARDAVTTQNDM